MVLIHKETFDILKSCSIKEETERYFLCDEAIAPAIALLNKKGYRTAYCCSGHLYDEITDTLVLEDDFQDEELLREVYPGIIQIQKSEEGLRLKLRQNLSMQAYVTFEEDLDLPSLPEGWRERGRSIFHNFYWDESFPHPYAEKELQASSPYRFYERRLEIMEALYNWAEALPERDQKKRGNKAMEVRSSEYLVKRKDLLKKLVDELKNEYRYVSVLAMDNQARSYRVGASGVSAGPDSRFTNRGFVVRVRDEKGYAEYSFNHIDEAAIPAICEKLKKELIPMKDEMPEGIGFLERGEQKDEPVVFKGATEYEIWPYDMGDEKIFEVLNQIRAQGKAFDERILDCNASFSFQEIHKLFLSPEKDLEQNIMWSSGSVMVMALKGQEMVTSHQGYSGLSGAELLSGMTADVDHVAATGIELLSAEPITPGEYECVCMPSVTGMIVHEAFGHGVEMDMFVKDRALAKNYIGEYVASPLVTMHDGAAVMKESGSYFFDDDGNMAKDTVIIDKGILRTGMCDELSAEVLKIPSTGNGRRESYERKAYTRMTNTYFEAGNDTLEDMIASIDYGFVLDQPTSGMEDPKNWGIQCMVNFAREIKDGKLTGKIFSPIVLTGFVPDLLKSISMMGGEIKLEGGGMCGKGYKEWVKVSDGGPAMKARVRLG